LFERKGCIHCHAVNGWGTAAAPDLGMRKVASADLSELVTAMWNHAPKMWEQMQARNIAYPAWTRQQMADLFSFLYLSRYVDEAGDPNRGRDLFFDKQCSRCHIKGRRGQGLGPDLETIGGLGTPVVWAEEMWNHAPAMEEVMKQADIAWPTFEAGEMGDLLAYIRENSGARRHESQVFPADPLRGRKVFESKGCTLCHSLTGGGTGQAPDLGAQRKEPLTLIQFTGAMWNHSPDMWRAMEGQHIRRPVFEGKEMPDLIAFLASLRSFEPGGSPATGERLITERGCHFCHGKTAEGSSGGPALRGRGKTYTLVTLAVALWSHGPKMWGQVQELGHEWPSLDEDDVGNLLAFLNTSVVENP